MSAILKTMQQKTNYILAVVIILIVGAYLLISSKMSVVGPTDYKNASYMIEGKPVVLGTEGTKYFGNEAIGDLNADGLPDIGFLITKDNGGSGTFYYAVAGIKNADGYLGTDAVFIGDRIAPQTTEIKNGLLLVNYADRAPNEPFVKAPSIGKSIWLKLDPKTLQFGEVVQNFEGEADPNRMTLGMKEWIWIKATYSDGKTLTPNKPEAFKITFSNDGRFSAKTDCNSVGGSYVATAGKITFSQMMSTLMFCEGSQEADFTKLLSESSGYHFTSKGELILDLKFDSGSVIFR